MGSEIEQVSTLLRYAATPQYLRRKAFPMSPILQFAGILPPLRTPNHQLNAELEKLPKVSYREGIVLSASGGRCEVDVGLTNRLVVNSQNGKPGDGIILQVKRDGKLRGEAASENDVPHYFGIRSVKTCESLQRAMEGDYDLRIATSRFGDPLDKSYQRLSKALIDSREAIILFGSPYQGLQEIAREEGFDLAAKVNFTLNTIPDQGTATVRTEEALSSTLAILNYLTHTT